MESAIRAIVSPIIDSIVTPLIQQAKYLLNTEANVNDLEEASKDLSLTKDEVLQQIATATSTSDEIVPTKRVKTWMEDIESLETTISKIVEDYDDRTTCFGGHCTKNCWSSYRISKRAANAAEGAKELIKKKQNFDGLTERRAPPIRRLPTLTSDATADSTDRYLNMVFGYLQDEEVGMVGIWGMGGVGKTTLLRKINNHPFVASAGFDYVIWLDVSQEPDLDRLQKETAKRLGLTFEEGTTTLDSRAQVLSRYLVDKRFLLLLDNIWDPLELARLGIPCPMSASSSSGIVPKRKVLFTTRSETTCKRMMACQKFNSGCRKIKIKCLQQEVAWKLFLHNVGEDTRTIINTDKRVCSLAEKVAEKCGGLPLAIAVIAQAMSANETRQEWEAATNSMERIGIQEMWSKEEEPFPLLKVSYDRLPNDNVKNCFLSCALVHQFLDNAYLEFDLINFWLSMNVIDEFGDFIESYKKGFDILQILKRACLLEEHEVFACVKMHDVIRGMALWIISECKKEWIIIDQAKRKNESDEDEAEWTTRDAKTILLIHGRPGMQLPQHPDCPSLSALMLRENNIDMIPERFFQNMNALTCLDISHNKIGEIPSAIGGLLHLRYLDLSGTSISSLPMELGNLIQLKRLSLNYSIYLISIPHGLISRLQKLAHLELLDTAFEAWDTEGQASIQELVRSGITSLSFDVTRLETLEQLSKNRHLSLWRVVISELEGVTTLPLRSLLQNGNMRRALLHLSILRCDHLEEMSVSSQSEEEFDNLERLYLLGNPALKKITSSGGSVLLRNVRELFFSSCDRLKNATWIVHLPYLESLEITACNDMEHVIADEEDDNAATERSDIEAENRVTFSKLRVLSLFGLPELRSFSTRAFSVPLLTRLAINRCPQLDVELMIQVGCPAKKKQLQTESGCGFFGS